MSHRIRQLVWERSGQKEGTLLVALALAEHASEEGLARPSVHTLATMARLSDRMVQKALRRLEAAGEVVIEAVGTGRGHASRYRLTVAAKGELERVNSGERVNSDSPITAERVNASSPIAAERVNCGAPIRPPLAAKGELERVNSGRKGELGASERVNSAPVPSGVRTPVSGTPGTGLREPGVPAGRPAGLAREDSDFFSEFAGQLSARLGFRCDADRLAPVLADFPELDAATLVAELEAAASKPDRGRPWTLASWRAWLETGRQHRAARANGHGARVRTAADDVPAELRAKYGPAVERAHV